MDYERVTVFVLLGHGFGAGSWRDRHARGAIAGLNEVLPFGYYRAAGDGWEIEYSQDADEGPITEFVRRGLTRLLGFDVIHAWRNRDKLFAADVVWTHSEREHLAALLLRRLAGRGRSPRIIGECIWLPDRWHSFWPPKRALYRWLLRGVDAVSSQSQDGVNFLRQLLPGTTVEWIPGGAKPDFLRPPTPRSAHDPVRVAVLGGDMHRDWETLLSAFAGAKGFKLRIAPSKGKIRLGSGTTDITVARAYSEADVRALYDWADIVVMPLKPNLHASGITVIFEAIVLGIPIVCTDAGGLRAYFPGGELWFVPPGDPNALREAVRRLASDGERCLEMAAAAQRRVLGAGLTTQGYADGYRRLSARLLAPRATAASSTPHVDTVLATRPDTDRLRAFVLLGHGFGAERWRTRFARHEIPGLNDALPYGYYRASGQGWSVKYSEDADEHPLARLVRRGLSRVLGLDLIHAWRNRGPLLAAEVVWTHTEREGLSALALFRLLGRRSRPRLVAQCVWLFDRWDKFSWLRRAAYRLLLKEADVITTLSPENRNAALRIFPEVRTQLVLFGVGAPEEMRVPQRTRCHAPVRIAGLGGDMHRDWKTFLQSFGGWADFDLRIASSKARLGAHGRSPNVTVWAARSDSEVEDLYGWADMVVVSLKPNLHASGITVILEAVAYGVPVVASDVGGLRAYFSDREVCYVPAGEPDVLREAVRQVADDHERRFDMTVAAQRRVLEARLTWEGYAMRHLELSEALLGRRNAGERRSTETTDQQHRCRSACAEQ